MKEVVSYQCEFTERLFPTKEDCAHCGLTYLLGDDHAAHEALANSAAVIALLTAAGATSPAAPVKPGPVASPEPAKPGTDTASAPAKPAATPAIEPPVCGATTEIASLHPHLSNKTIGALTRAGFRTLGDLVTKSPEMLLSGVDRFGKGALAEVQAVMEAAGLSLATEWKGEDGDTVLIMPRPEPLPEQPTARVDGTLSDEAPAERPTMPVTAEIVGNLRQASLEELTQKIQANGSNGHTSLREFLRNAEHHLGRDRVVAIMEEHGVARIADVGANEPDLRAAIEEAMTA